VSKHVVYKRDTYTTSLTVVHCFKKTTKRQLLQDIKSAFCRLYNARYRQLDIKTKFRYTAKREREGQGGRMDGVKCLKYVK